MLSHHICGYTFLKFSGQFESQRDFEPKLKQQRMSLRVVWRAQLT